MCFFLCSYLLACFLAPSALRATLFFVNNLMRIVLHDLSSALLKSSSQMYSDIFKSSIGKPSV